MVKLGPVIARLTKVKARLEGQLAQVTQALAALEGSVTTVVSVRSVRRGQKRSPETIAKMKAAWARRKKAIPRDHAGDSSPMA